MKRSIILCCLLLLVHGVFAQSKQHKSSKKHNPNLALDSIKTFAGDSIKKDSSRQNLIMIVDTLTPSDYIMSVERVNDNLNSIRDSAKLGFEVVGIGRRIEEMTKDIELIRQNIRGKRSVVNMKNLYLYQSLTLSLDKENDRIQANITKMYKRVYNAKQHLKNVLNDTIFRKLYADSLLRVSYKKKLDRLQRKWARADTLTKTNVDSLNVLKVKLADNSMSLSGMLNMLDTRLDRAGQQLFGNEVCFIWQKPKIEIIANDSTKNSSSIFFSEQKAIGFYFSQTRGERGIVLFLAILLFIWLFFKRKLLKSILEQKGSFDFLHLKYMNHHPVWALIVLLLCLMPFFDAYAPSSYVAVEYFLVLIASSIIFFKRAEYPFRFDWLMLTILFVANAFTYFLMEPTILSRLWLLTLQLAIIVFSYRFQKKLNKLMPYYKLIKISSKIGMVLAGLGILCNIFGRFSLSGLFGTAGIYAVTQALVLTVLIDTIIEVLLLQLQSIRMNKGINKAFDCSSVTKKIQMPLLLMAMVLWFIMLCSNLNIYHFISKTVVGLLTNPISVGSISFELISILLFFAIIWLAHLSQRLISFLFGETGSDTDDSSTLSKGQHSRLLITRLMVLIGGYFLAIAASGLPIDKLTFLLGALGVGIGMGLQNVVNNFVSGIILIFDGSLLIGDEIEVSGQSGKVKEIGLRSSTLNTADGASVIIPNGSILSQTIVNWTLSNNEKRVLIEFSLKGEELDSNQINDLINETIGNIKDVIVQKKPVILYTRVKKSSCSISVRFWSSINKADSVKSEATLNLSTAFAAKNIGFK
jgi:potassium-dependent mechanosensitive channel